MAGQDVRNLGFQGLVESVDHRKEVRIGSTLVDQFLREYPPVVQSPVCSRCTKFSMELDEKIAEVASALTRSDDPWTRHVRVLHIEE